MTEKIRCVLLGGGGHARVVIDCLLASGAPGPFAILDPSLVGQVLQTVPVLGGDEILLDLARDGTDEFVVTVGSVGDSRTRERLFAYGLSFGLRPLTVRHPSAVLSPFARVAAGTVLLPGSIVNAGASLGQNVIVNSGAIVEHDCAIEDHAHVATGARLASGVHVGRGAHVGAGATVRQGLRIGDAAVVGAGAVVVKDVAARTVVVGVPARVLKVRS